MSDIESQPESVKEPIHKKIFMDAMWSNIILAALLGNFMYMFILDFYETPKFSTILIIIQMFCLVLFVLIRVLPQRVSQSPKDWVFALSGCWLPLLLMPVSGAQEIAVFLILQFIGIIIATIGLINLNKSFGIVPALRPIKTGGFYRIIRHPIYFGYFLSMSAMVVQNVSIWNVLVLLGIIISDIFRILGEEAMLNQSEEYQHYSKRVKWRVVPFIW